MDFSSHSFAYILLLSAFLGARHGFDPDHLATIDALTRLGRVQSRRFVGLAFSLGHGFMIVCVAVGVAWLGKRWVVPAWFETFGLGTSIVLLLVLGSINLWALLSTPSDRHIGIHSPRALWIERMQDALPLQWDRVVPFLVGGLFAVSFDTLSQAVLFSSVSVAHNTVSPIVVGASMGCAFTVGMVISDGLNGWLIGALVQRADATAILASRLMCAAVVVISYGVAALAIIKLMRGSHWPVVELFFEPVSGSTISISITLLVLASFGYGQWQARDKQLRAKQSREKQGVPT